MKWIGQNLEKLRNKKPLVHNITNLVVMNSTANALLAVGASPIMAHCPEEIDEMVAIADAVLLNIGTLDQAWINSMTMALDKANQLNKPVVLDPVGAGASKIRTQTAKSLLEKGVTIVKGNFDEINALLNNSDATRGVDSVNYDTRNAPDLAINAAKKYNTIAAVTGPVDFVSDGKITYSIRNGHPFLSYVTGTGCTAAALSAAFAAIADPLGAAVSALTVLNIAAELAAGPAVENTDAPGSFNVKLIDWLYKTDANIIAEKIKVQRYG